MENTINLKLIGCIVAAFLIGSICGYQYSSYSATKQIKEFLGMNDKSSSKKMNDFFDYKPDTK
jgi:hypothetical protein